MSLNNAHEGYAYQDLLTIYFILDELLKGNKKSIFTIDKKHIDNDRFDDLVITNGTNIQRKQIKYSNETTAKELAKDDFSNDSNYKLAIYELYSAWKRLNSDESEFRLCLAWEEPSEANLTKVLELLPENKSSFLSFKTKLFKINLDALWEENPEKFNRWNSLKKYVKENDIDRADFKKFCEELIIEVELPKASLDISNPRDLESILLGQAQRLGIGVYPNDDIYIVDFLERFAKKIGEYRAKSQEVSLEKILMDLRVRTDFGNIEQKFDIDKTKNIKHIDKFDQFRKKVSMNKKTLLIGEPGSGKSWFLTNFIEYLNETSTKVIRHYCFTATDDKNIEKRVSSNIFFGNLIADIIKAFPHLEQEKEKLFASDLYELNLLLSHIKTELIVIIDGLDHISRVLKNSSSLAEDKTKIIEYISNIQLPDNIFIVLGSQSVNEIRVLKDNYGYEEFHIPNWGLEDTVDLMGKYSLENFQLDDKLLSVHIFEKSEANPLYLTYLIKTLLDTTITLEAIEQLPKYDFNLKAYYDYLIAQIENNLTSEILSCLEFAVSRKELSELISPWSHHLDSNLKVLSPVIVENYSKGGIKLYHDSFRRFNIEKLEEDANIEKIYETITAWLEDQSFYQNAKSYRYLLKYYIKLRQYEEVKKYATNDFLTESLYNGYPDNVIKINYNNFLYVATKTLDWPLFAYISELNKTIATTISEEYHSEFIEYFELFFEAVGLIYGFERANEMLFYDGEKNFSDEIIAKAFYISQKNSYVPRWDLIDSFFGKEIPLENYRYYLCSLIAKEFDLQKEFEELISEDYPEFIKIFIEEVYSQIGIEKILQIVNLSELDINYQINNVLSSLNANALLLTSPIKVRPLPPLDLTFTENYIDDDVLENFIELIHAYAIQDIESLIIFNESIAPKNFFFNWIKFIINQNVIEHKMDSGEYSTYAEFEKNIVQNLTMLSNDVDPFKGKPRAMDLSRKHSQLLIESLDRSLKYMQSSHLWQSAIESLQRISFGTMGYLQSMQMGVLPYGLLIDLLINYLNEVTEKFIIDVIENIDMRDETYSYHLEYKLKKSIVYSKLNQNTKAQKALKQAVSLITSYTFRKDRTLSEIIAPLNTINDLDHEFAKKYAKKLKYLTDAVMKHTEDGKDTRWLTIEWFKEFLEVDYKLSSMYLVHQFMHNEYFWKLDYMFVDYIQASKDRNPVILNFLFKLSPTNTKYDYINSFLDNIHTLLEIDQNLAKQSLLNVLNRDLNNSYDSLKDNTIQKIQGLKLLLNIATPIKQKKDDKSDLFHKSSDSLSEQINLDHSINSFVFFGKDLTEVNKYFDRKRDLTNQDFNNLFFYLLEKDDDEIAKKILMPLIKEGYSRTDDFFEEIRLLINSLSISDTTRMYLLVQTFVYSKDGWYSPFINISALENALFISKEEMLNILAKSLFHFFSNFGYSSSSTANLIIAFKSIGLEKNDILSMYKNSFEFFEYRLPDENDFNWDEVEDKQIEQMNNNELAIVMLLSKMKNYDAIVQKEIVLSINYLLNYDEELLVKPMKWFFENVNHFPHISIAIILELFKLHTGSKIKFFIVTKKDIQKVKSLKNLYIENILDEIIEQIDHV